MTPIDALQKTIESGWLLDCVKKLPGTIVQRMPPDVREALVRLTSDDALNLRPDYLVKS